MDLMTWTSVVHPTMMVPLQDKILHLQQRNELQRKRTSALNETTASLKVDEQNLLDRIQETQQDVAAARAFRAEVNEQIRRSQVVNYELATSIEAEEKKIQLIQGEVARLHMQNDTADLDVAHINEETERVAAASAGLQDKYQFQQQGRQSVAAQRAVRCEMIGMLRQFPSNEALQTRALRALHVVCKKPATRRQLLIYGLQDALVEVLQQLPRRSSVYLGVCEIITQISDNSMPRWNTKALVEALLAARISVRAESPTTLDDVYQAALSVFACLRAAPQLNDVDITGEKCLTEDMVNTDSCAMFFIQDCTSCWMLQAISYMKHSQMLSDINTELTAARNQFSQQNYSVS
ncbi:hypothetical protein DVH05_002733 [Phytophthora capsici]|nr:hypothetical protein DVH05_002733 [Phytophthora capsici]